MLSIEPVIKNIRLQAKVSIEKELERAIKKKFIPSEYKENIEKMAEQMFNRFLHDSTQNLRQCSAELNSTKRVEAIKEIFNIKTDDVNTNQYKDEHHVKGYQK
jgi:glutamyl-tRNA reductase